MARRKSNAAKAAERAVKKTHTATIVLAVLFLIVGAVAGVLVSRNLTKDDRFVLVFPVYLHKAPDGRRPLCQR